MNFLQGLVGGGGRAGSPEEVVCVACRSASLLAAACKAKRAGESKMTVPSEQQQQLGSSEVVDVSSQLALSRETVGKQLVLIKAMLMGDGEREAADASVCERVVKAALDRDLARCVAACIVDLPLESAKAAAHVVSNLVGRSRSFAEHVASDGFTLEALCRAYPENGEVALACGTMLREAASAERAVAAALLRSPCFWLFLSDYCTLKNFDLASDAFQVLRVLLTAHKQLAADFVSENYDFFFECFHRLLHSDNYATCRESLSLLSELLLERANYAVMIKYIQSRDNLKTMMLLLRSKKFKIQIESFHVFKIFVANPRKSTEVAKVLYDNKDKLVAYLATFASGPSDGGARAAEGDGARGGITPGECGADDEQFLEEKQLVIETLINLKDPSLHPPGGPPPHVGGSNPQ